MLCAWLVAALAPVAVAYAARMTALRAELSVEDCGYSTRDAPRWRRVGQLDEAAELWARGADLNEAATRSGYPAAAVSGLHRYGMSNSVRPRLNDSGCRIIRDRSLKDVGRFRERDEQWILFGARVALPDSRDQQGVARRATELVNRVRNGAHECGEHHRPPAGPLRYSAALSAIATLQAQDMLNQGYFDHIDKRGRSPADRVRVTGYTAQLVGENIARGPLSTDEVVAGWLKSPEHCENLMEPRFKEAGVGFARARQGSTEVYWVQVLALPR